MYIFYVKMYVFHVKICMREGALLSLELPSTLGYRALPSPNFLPSHWPLLQSPMYVHLLFFPMDTYWRASGLSPETSCPSLFNSLDRSYLFSILSMQMILRLESPVPSSPQSSHHISNCLLEIFTRM